MTGVAGIDGSDEWASGLHWKQKKNESDLQDSIGLMMTHSNTLDSRLTVRLEVVPGDNVVERVELAAQCGFDGIAFPGLLSQRFAEETLANLQQLALPIKTVSLGFEGSLCSPDENQRQRCRDSLRQLFDFTQALGAISVNIPPILNQFHRDRYPAEAIEEQDELLVRQLPELGEQAAQRGLELLIEPVNRYETDYLKTISHAARLCAAVNHPAVGMTVDFFHMQMEESDNAAALTGAAPWIRHVHVAENTRCEPGSGQLDFQPGFRALQDLGYRGLVELECRSLSGPAHACLTKSASWLRSQWQQAGCRSIG